MSTTPAGSSIRNCTPIAWPPNMSYDAEEGRWKALYSPALYQRRAYLTGEVLPQRPGAGSHGPGLPD